MGKRSQFQSQGAVRAPSVTQAGQRGQVMGRGRGRGPQAGTSGVQGLVYAITSPAESVDQPVIQGMLGSLVATPSLLSRVIESQGQDAVIVSIKDRVQSGTGDEGWTIHTDGSLRYRVWVVVP